MFDLAHYLQALLVMTAFAVMGWLVSVIKNNVTLVDSMWSLFFLLAACAQMLSMPAPSARAWLVMVLVAVWAVRLSVYLSWRNWSPHEDHRYQAIRARNQPHFWLKSLYLVFGLQCLLAWTIFLPIHATLQSTQALSWLDLIGGLLCVFGFAFETIADWQLLRFKQAAQNRGKVLNTGVWRYSRHPNYFGECCVWWGFFVLALSAGAWWSVLSPILMTLLLLKVSGVALLEKDIAERRPDYLQYVKETNAFIPWKKTVQQL